jgi:hypothetical protein
MKKFGKISDNIVSSGRRNIKLTEDYKKKVEQIQCAIESKYSDLIKNETNFFKKTLLRLNKRLESKKAINKLTSLDNLYLKVI